ncbi:GDYXXLXY domain-containing protein, partial [Acinetobacter sp. NIOH-H-8]|uniref:GDYXXLXY domain-containing protein n=1 Tax=Acinetobacter sp. NIOH-H-8 TaxID=3342120 RepID=UPI00398592C5
MRRLGFFLTGLAILVGINVTVWRFEHAISSGENVLLELAPVDPRSLMQGDYMRLSYALARQLGSPHQEGAAPQILVIRLAEQQVAQRVEGGAPDALAPDERLLQDSWQQGECRIGPDAFFIEVG